LTCLLSLLLVLGAAPSVARAADGDLRTPLPKVPALIEARAVSGDHVLAVVDGEFQVSHNQGKTWVTATLPSWSAPDAFVTLGLDKGLLLVADEEGTRAALYSLADNKVTKEHTFSGSVAALTSTHAVVNSGNDYLLKTLDGSVPDRTLPSGYNWNRVLDGGYALGYRWDDMTTVVVLADGSNNVAEIARGYEAWATGVGSTIAYGPGANSAEICVRTTTAPAATCQTLTSAEPKNDRWVEAWVYGGGVLAQLTEEESFERPIFWMPLSGAALQKPNLVKLGSDVADFDIVRTADVPVLATVTASESYLERVTSSGATSRAATGYREPGWQVVSGLTPTDVLLQGYNPHPKSTTWRRSVGSSIGAASELSTLDGKRSSALASAGRWLVPTGTSEVTLYDRGKPVEPITGLYAGGSYSGYNAAGGLSGPNLLLEREDELQFRDAAGKWTQVPRARAIFGGLVLEDLSDYDADKFVGRFRVRDLSGDGGPTIDFSPPRFDGGEVFWWGDTIAYEDDAACYDDKNDEEQDAVVVYNFRTSKEVFSACGDLANLGDGFVVLWDGSGTAAVSFTKQRTSLDGSGWGGVIDGARVAYTTSTELVIQTIPGVAKSAPRSLGVKAPASYDGEGLWMPEIDLTKPVRQGELVVKNASGTIVRSLAVPASADGSIRGVGWDGKDSMGKVVAKGTYTIELTTPAVDGTGPVVRTDGSAGALAKVAVDITVMVPGTPTITGTAGMDQTLTAKPGTWSPDGVTHAYQWLRDGSAIAGATSSTYRVQAADVGGKLSVKVTGSKAGYASVSSTSAPTAAVAAGALTAAVPTVSGVAKVNGVLTASSGTWGPAPVALAYQWLRGGSPITGATAAKYTVRAADVGKALSVKVTGSKAGYSSGSKTSAATSAVPKALKLKASPTPKIKGKAKVGSKLTVSTGTWKPKPVPLTVQWYRAGRSAPVATGSSYTLTPDDAGKKITVKVTGAKVGYASVTKSKSTKKVAAGTLTAATPKIKGSAKVGATLTASVGTWKPAPVTLKYQWLRNGKAIKGATRASYLLTASDKGKKITVKVTGSKPGFKAASKTSKKTGKVKA
jgi:hypothetical protein